jgi:hypothetical protein
MRDRYVMLLTSLPHLGPLFRARQTPLSRPALDRRLRGLEPEDRAVLERVTGVLSWSRLDLDERDATLVRRAEAVLAGLDSPTLGAAIIHRLEVRTAVAALRARHLERPRPPAPAFGFGRAARIAVRRWEEPHLGLERVLPWLPEARSLLQAGDARGLERLLLAVVWRRLGRLAREHQFDLEAVVLYVLRWQIQDRWTRQHPGLATRRFQTMAAAILEAGPPTQPAHG